MDFFSIILFLFSIVLNLTPVEFIQKVLQIALTLIVKIIGEIGIPSLLDLLVRRLTRRGKELDKPRQSVEQLSWQQRTQILGACTVICFMWSFNQFLTVGLPPLLSLLGLCVVTFVQTMLLAGPVLEGGKHLFRAVAKA